MQNLKNHLTPYLAVGVVALIGAWFMVRFVSQPTYTDSFYHYNAAVRWAQGDGLTDPYIWTYVGQQAVGQPAVGQQSPVLIVPSHRYWMPATSLFAGASMALFGAPANYAVAQLPLVLFLAATVLIAYALGWRVGGSARHAWAAALLTLFSGFFANFWGEMDTFAPYAFFGAASLAALGVVLTSQPMRWWWLALAGFMAGFGHLTRSDGLLLLMVGVMLLPLQRQKSWGQRAAAVAVFVAAYLVAMGGWFIHLYQTTGAILPVGGLQAIWFTEYNDLFRYPPDADAARFFADGGGITRLIETRGVALVHNLQTFFFVEGWIVLMPLILWGAWRRRGWMLAPVLLFALGLHVAMTFVFPFPGFRGGLLHGAVALIPFWAVLAIVGLDAAIDWMAKRRRTWRPATAKPVFTVGVVLLAVLLTVATGQRRGDVAESAAFYQQLQALLPTDARVLINDPAQLYYYTGLGGAVLPNNPPEVLPQLAQTYAITHLVLEHVVYDETDDTIALGGALPAPLMPILTQTPDFLIEIESPLPQVRIYAFR